jgi:two-component system, OmpR family, sensor histidine kinase TctE
MPSRSIRRDITLLTLAPVFILLIALGAVTYHISWRLVTDAHDDGLEDTAKLVAAKLQSFHEHTWLEMNESAQEVIFKDPEERLSFQVILENGDVVAGDPEFPSLVDFEGEDRFSQVILHGTPARLFEMRTTPVGNNGKDHLIVRVAEPRHIRVAVLQKSLRAIALEIVLAALLCLSSVWILISRYLSPLKQMTTSVQRGEGQTLVRARLPRELQPLTAAFQRQLAKLYRDLERQRELLATVAHQLKGPLASMANRAESTLQAANPDAALKTLATMHAMSERTGRLVSQILSLARAEAPQSPSRDQAFVSEIIRHVVSDLLFEADAKGIECVCSGLEDDLTLDANADYVYEALRNLVENAITYCHRSSTIWIDVEAKPQPRIIVEDNGPGIPRGMREQIFGKFVRLTEEGTGSGLGLAITREIMSRTNGHVYIEDPVRSAHGTRVVLEFAKATSRSKSSGEAPGSMPRG